MKKKVAVVLVDRANYGRMKPVLEEIQKNPDLEMQLICSGTLVLERFGSPVNIIRGDGFEVSSEIYIELEGSNPITMSKSLGFAVIEFSSEFQRLKPDLVLVIGDRYEALAATLAASYMNFCIAHIQGGEVSGSIDESARHCMTKLSHYHFPATDRARDFIVRMGERPETVFKVGCPSGDIALKLDRKLPKDVFNSGVGGFIDPEKPYLLVLYHPTTTKFGDERIETENLLNAMAEVGMPTVWLWPNVDAGSDHVSNAIRSYREKMKPEWLRLIKNFQPETYLRVLANAKCAIGNSSSFVRDSTFFGTPIVLVGDRQDGREVGENLVRCPPKKEKIVEALRAQIAKGARAPSGLYGDGQASRRIVEKLVEVSPYLQKRLAFID